MKNSFLLLLFLSISISIFAQTDTLTTRDDVQFKYKIRKTLLSNYEKLLNFIADPDNPESDIPEIIASAVNGSRELRLFSDENVVVENDLKPGADVNEVLRPDQKIIPYLNNFNIGYSKSPEKTVLLSFIKISALKHTSYYYYNLVFECNFKGTNSAGQSFNPFTRVAEIKLVNDSGWHAYINGIRFLSNTENDSLNVYESLIPVETDALILYNAYDNEEQKKKNELKRKMLLLLEEGQNNYTSGNLPEALTKFHEARMVNYEAKEPKEWSSRVRKELEEKKAQAEQKNRNDQHIEFLKRETLVQITRLNFSVAKVITDSLIYEYGVNDAQILKLSGELSIVNASIEGINSTRLKGKFEEAIKLCQKKQVEITDSFYCSHFYYLEADILSADIKPNIKHIVEKLDRAIALSGKRHQDALKMRSYIRVEKQNNSAGAIEDATLVVNNDPRNPEVYNFRASIYERDKNLNNAIADYANAIANKTTNPIIFLKKSQFEYELKKYSDAIKSAGDGLDYAKCSGQLYLYKGLAELQCDKLIQAGKDFWMAEKKCGINEQEEKVLRLLSDSCYRNGNILMTTSQWEKAIKEYSKSIIIDSNENSFYQRAACFIAINKNDSAVIDLDRLSAANPVFRNIYSLRASAYNKMGKFDKANNDFEISARQFPDDTSAFYNKGQSEITHRNYKAAIASLEQALKLFPSDSTYFLLSQACYYDKNYDQAIAYSKKARSKHSTDFSIFYICGLAYFSKGDFKSALDEFAIAKTNISFDAGLWFANATALEGMQKYREAAIDYDQLIGTVNYRDTANFRSAYCKIKIALTDDYPRAINQLNQYIYSLPAGSDKSTPYAWQAYAYLSIDSISQSADAIAEAKKYNEHNAVLELVLACRSAKAEDYQSACIFLERALASRQFKKEDIEEISMLDILKKKNKKYKALMHQYFQ